MSQKNNDRTAPKRGPGRPTTSNSIYEYDAQLALAFKQDCTTLLERFQRKKTFRFQTFAKEWTEMSFIQVFEGEEYFAMLQTFIDNCFLISKKFLFSDDIHTAIGALYLMYSLYYKQPIKDWVQIRLTMSEAAKIEEIITQSQSIEASYIFSKLKVQQAFRYVALPTVLAPYGQYLRRINLTKVDFVEDIKQNNDSKQFDNILDDPLYKDLEETSREYQLLYAKCSQKYPDLVASSNVNICEEIAHTHKEIFRDISDT